MIQTLYNSLTDLHGLNLVLALLFVTLFFVRLLFLFLFTGRFLFQKKIISGDPTPLSLIYTVRNEEDRLKDNLVPVLSINNCEFEVIVVDNFSQDNSFQVLGMLRGRSDRLKVSTLFQETRFSNKMAQNLALKAAGYNWILAVPISYENATSQWISGISNVLNNNDTVLLLTVTFNILQVLLTEFAVPKIFYRLQRAQVTFLIISLLFILKKMSLFKRKNTSKLAGMD